MEDGNRSPEDKNRSPEDGNRSPEDKNRSPEDGNRSPEDRNRSPEDGNRSPEDGNCLPEDRNLLPEDGNRIPVYVNPLPEDEELPESEELLTEEYDSVFDDVSLEDDNATLTDDDVMLEVIQEVSEEEADELPEDNQSILAAIQDDLEDPHKLAIEQIDLALAHLSNNSERLKVLETHIDSLENDSDSSEDCKLEVDQTAVDELKALVARLEDELHCVQIQQLQAEINALKVSAAVADQKLSENCEQLVLKERVLQDSSTLIRSLINALENARSETTAARASLNSFKRRCHKAERKSLVDRKRVSTAAARREASLIEQRTLQARVEELEAQIDNMWAEQAETIELEVSEDRKRESSAATRHEASLMEEENLEARVEESEAQIDNMGVAQDETKELEVFADRKKVSSAAARHEASLIEEENLEASVEESEAQIDNMGAAQDEIKELEVSADRKQVSSAAARHEASLIEEENLEASVEESEVQIDNMEAAQDETKELEVFADRKRESSAAVKHEASLIEEENLETRVEESEAQIDNMGVAQDETKEVEVSAEVREENDNLVNAEMSDSTKTTDKVTPDQSKLIARLALMERGYSKMLGYTRMLKTENAKLRKTVVPNQLSLNNLAELEKDRDAALEQVEKLEIELREYQFKLDSFEGMLEIPMTPYIQANIAAAAAMERSQQNFYPEQSMPVYPNIYSQPPVQAAPPSPKFVVPTTAPARPFIIHLGSKNRKGNSTDKESLDSDSSSGDAQIGAQRSTEVVQPPNTLVQEEAVTSTTEVQHSTETLTDQAQGAAESLTDQKAVNAVSSTLQDESSTEQVQPTLTEAQQAPPKPVNPPTSLFQQPDYVIPPPFNPFCRGRPGSHSFVYKDVRENRRCRWCWCGLIPRNTVQCQVCKILVHNTCKKAVPFTCGYPDPIWNHYISLPVSHTEIPATQSYTLPNPCCWVFFRRVRPVLRFVMLHGPSINIYHRVPGPYDFPLETIPLQMCGLMPRLIVDLTNRYRGANVDKCIAYQQMVTPNPKRRQGTAFMLEFGNHWDRECFIDAISLFIDTLTPPGPSDHIQEK